MPIGAGILRSVARSVIPKMFTGGYSATSALNYFRSIGGQIRTQTWYSDWREIAGMKKLERTYRFVPRKYRLSYGMMAPTETYQSTEFKYVFDVHGRDAETGEYAVRTMSFGSDERYSPDGVEGAYADLLSAETNYYLDEFGFIPDAVELVVVSRLKRPLGIKGMSEAELARWYGV